MNDGELQEWCEVTQELRQRCVPSPLVLDIFFASALEIVLVRFSEDAIFLKDMVYLDQEIGKEAEIPLERLERAVWRVRYDRDVAVVSRCPQGLARMMTVIVRVFVAFGLTVSEKTQILPTRVPHKSPQWGEPPTPPPPSDADH